MRPNLCVAVFLALCALLFLAPLGAQATNAPAPPSTNAPAAVLPPVGIPMANVASSAIDDANKLQDIQAGLTGDHTVADVRRDLVASTGNIDQRKKEADALLQGPPSLPLLRTTQQVWEMLAREVDLPQAALSNRLAQLNEIDAQLGAMDQKWKATRAVAKTSAAPPDILTRIDSVTAAIAQTTRAVAPLRSQIWSAQNDVSSQHARIAEELVLIRKRQGTAVTALFVRDSAPLWALAAAPSTPVASGTSAAFATDYAKLRAYVAEKFATAILHLAIFVGLAFALFFVRRAVVLRTKDDPPVQHAAEVFQAPIAMAAVLAFLLSHWFYPLAPPLFWALLGASALLPAVALLRRIIEKDLLPILYALVVAYIADQVRHATENEPDFNRWLSLAELLCAVLFLFWLLSSKRLSQAGRSLLERLVRIYSMGALIIFTLAFLANVLGYTHLSSLAGNGMFVGSYLAVILYAAVRIADGLIIAALRIWPFSLLGMVQRHDQLIASKISTFVRWLAFLWWAWLTLELFSIRSLIIDGAWAILTYKISYNTQPLSLGPLLLFILTIWAAVLLSRLVRFVLREEVFPNLRLGPGVPYAISNMVHYAVLVFGTLFALNGLGIQLKDYSILIGALGVGLGFGLQNIINNFVSGIILLFERPIKVGDVIQVDTAMGTVESIGIRASVIRITNGSEIIMPNGSLISSQVTNWTFSDRRRAVDIPISVANKTEPQKVMHLLIETAKANTFVLKDPPPQVLFTNFAGGTLNFELRAWTNSTETWGQIRSDLALAISAALERENIPAS